MDAGEYARTIRAAPSPEDRIAWFGALLGRETGEAIEIVGGSAVEVYLSSNAYVSQDVDVVGDRDAIENALGRWGFERIGGRAHRRYWTDHYLGLVDLVGLADNSGLPARRLNTPHGPVLLSAPEPLIIRRLSRAKREHSSELFRQAVLLGKLGGLDWDYLQPMARYEGIESDLQRLRAMLGGTRSRRSNVGQR